MLLVLLKNRRSLVLPGVIAIVRLSYTIVMAGDPEMVLEGSQAEDAGEHRSGIGKKQSWAALLPPRLMLTEEEKYENALNDELTFVETVYTSKLGSNIARTTGSLSAISSLLLIVLIYRSRIRLSTVYHRIMFCMSVSDILASVAMALTTLPMPKDMIYTQFEMKEVHGNNATCNAQGFVFFVGANFTFALNACLCIYYLFSIRYKMSEARIREKIEPYLYLGAVIISLPIGVIFLFTETYNPSPWDAWCTSMALPWQCSFQENRDECFFNAEKTAIAKKCGFFTVAGFFVGFFCLLGSMVLITISIYRQERLLKMYADKVYRNGRASPGQSENSSEDRNFASSRSRHHFTKVALYQALAYLSVFLLCQSNVFISLIRSQTSSYEDLRFNRWEQIYHLVTRPLQGFFNLLVFVSHKVYNMLKARRDLTILQAARRVLVVREEPAFIISQISLVVREQDEDNDDIDEIYFDGDDEDEVEERVEGSVMYPFPGQNDASGSAGSGVSYDADESDLQKSMEEVDMSLAESFEDHTGDSAFSSGFASRISRPSNSQGGSASPSASVSWFSFPSRKSRN